MHDVDRTANLLGATALAVTDLFMVAATRQGHLSESAAAALVVLSSASALSVTELGRRIGLSQSAATRVLESLEGEGLAERQRHNARWVTVRLTRRGRHAARGVLGGRQALLVDLVAGLDAAHQRELCEALERVLARLFTEIGSSELICRLCDRGVCTTGAVCPVGAAEREASR